MMLSGLPLSLAFSIAIERSRSISAESSDPPSSAWGCRGGDMLCDLPAEVVQNLGRRRALERHENANPAEVRGNLIVDIGHDRALLHFQQRSAA